MRRSIITFTIGVALAVTACGGSANDTAAENTIVNSSSDAGQQPAGVTLTYPDGTAVAFTATEIVEPSVPLPAGFTPAGPGYDIAVADGAIVDTATLTASGATPPAGATPVLLHLTDLGEYEPNAATYTDGVYSANVSTFSPHVFGWFTEWVTGATDSVVDYLTGRTDYPAECNPDPAVMPYPWVTATTGPPNGTYHACVYANPDPVTGAERVEVRIKSNRSMAQWLVLPTHQAAYMWVEGGSDWSAVGPVITELDDDWTGNRVLLAPGRTVTLGYTNPGEVAIPLEFSTYQNTTTQLVSVAYKYLGDAALLGATLVMISCLAGATVDHPDATHVSDLPAAAAISCFPDIARELVLGGVTDLTAAVSATFDNSYRSIINAGRLQLSAGSAANIEAMIGDATAAGKNARIANAFKMAGNALIAAPLLADATSMIQDALLAGQPGLNTYTVNLLGTGAPAPTGTAPPTISPIDRGQVLNATLPPTTCGWIAEMTGVQLVDGATPPAPDGEEIAIYVDDPQDAVFRDIDGDGIGDAALSMSCYGGGNAVWSEIIIWIAGQPPYIVGQDQLTSAPGVPTAVFVNDMVLFDPGTGIVVSWSGQLPEDADCCPSLRFDTYLIVSATGATVEKTIGIDPDTGDPFEL